MEWFAWPFMALWSLFCPRPIKQTTKKRIVFWGKKKTGGRTCKKPRKMPFYSRIQTRTIQRYQSYIDRAFALSPSLEFAEADDRFSRLLKEATGHHDLDDLDLELMRMQYVLADPNRREKYRGNWAVTVVNRRENDFFPSPWAILESLFAKTG